MKNATKRYLETLKARAKESRAYQKYQFVGLEIAALLQDTSHKALYIKLAKDHGSEELLALAKEVAQIKGVRNKGAYFMSCLAARNKQMNYRVSEDRTTTKAVSSPARNRKEFPIERRAKSTPKNMTHESKNIRERT